jgi:hypothetical protein
MQGLATNRDQRCRASETSTMPQKIAQDPPLSNRFSLKIDLSSPSSYDLGAMGRRKPN